MVIWGKTWPDDCTSKIIMSAGSRQVESNQSRGEKVQLEHFFPGHQTPAWKILLD